MKTAILVQTHLSINHIFEHAIINKSINYYIHVDKKSDISIIISERTIPENVFLLNNRIDINWGGFSQVEATILLFQKALENDENEYFHLISAEDFFLKDLIIMENEWDIEQPILMDIQDSQSHRYRIRFYAVHADTKYTRSFIGKVITKLHKFLDFMFPTKLEYSYYGSSWFSLKREEAYLLISSITELDIAKFKKKLCPDEHFFQYMIIKLGLVNKVSNEGNKRYIRFDKNYNRGNNPIYLSYDQIDKAKEEGFWFARKYDFSKNN